MVIEHEKLNAEMHYLRERVVTRGSISTGLSGVGASVQENERLKRIIYELESSLRQKETERNRLRTTTSTAADLDIRQQFDSSDVPRLQSHIQRVRAENQNLRNIAARGQFTSNRVKVGSRISHQETKREAGINTIGGGVYHNTGMVQVQSGVVRRSASSTPVYQQGGYTTGGYTTQGQVIQGGVTRTSGGYATQGQVVQGGVTRTSGGYTTAPGYTSTTAGPTYVSGGNAGYTTTTGGVMRPSGGYTTTTGGIVGTNTGISQLGTTGGVVRRSQTYNTTTVTAPGTTTYTQPGTVTYGQSGNVTYDQFGNPRYS